MRFPHCPRCGTTTRPQALEGRERDVCPACGGVWYDCAKPCATAVVEDGLGRVLLVRRGQEPHAGKWNLPGGFLEADEHPEEGACREAHEETGFEIELVRLLGVFLDHHDGAGDVTQAHHSVSVAYLARAVGGSWRPNAEAVEHAFFAEDELPGEGSLAYANHRRTLEAWRRHRRGSPGAGAGTKGDTGAGG